VSPTCPVHGDTLREEWAPKRTGFCTKCLKHYELCGEVRYMSICQKLKDHEGGHVTKRGEEWNGTDG